MTLIRAVRGLETAQRMRAVRNECRATLTGDQRELTEEDQEKFYYDMIWTGKMWAAVFQEGDETVAYCSVRSNDEGTSGFITAGVTDARRGQGYGKQAIKMSTMVAVEMYGRALGEARADNATSIHICHSVGFKDIDTYEHDGTEYVLMECT